MTSLGCPFCPKILQRKGDLARHMKESCGQNKKYHCPHCDQKVLRRGIFRNHHEQKHMNVHCRDAECAAGVEQNNDPSGDRYVLGCGFCVECFTDDPSGFVDHLTKHYASGLARESWSVACEIQSLLSQPRMLGPWYDLCSNAFNNSPGAGPVRLLWSLEEAEWFTRMFSKKDWGGELDYLLYLFFDRGLTFHHHRVIPVEQRVWLIVQRTSFPQMGLNVPGFLTLPNF